MNKKTHFYVFRHGQTDWNAQKRFQGHTDIPLNESGRSQALELAEKIKRLSPQVVLSSDLSRALETAKIATSHLQLPFHVSEKLRETLIGEPEGMLRDDIITKYGSEFFDKWASMDPQYMDYAFPGGQSKREHQIQLISELKNFAHSNHDIDHVAVSTHGGALLRIVHYCHNAPFDPVPITNCILYHVYYDLSDGLWHFVGEIR